MQVTAAIRTFVTKSMDFRTRHVYSHTNEPWNELADTICDMSSRRHYGFGWSVPPAALRSAIRECPRILDWLHMECPSASLAAEFPPVLANGSLAPWNGIAGTVMALPDEVIAHDIGSAGPEQTSKDKYKLAPSGWFVMSLNAQSLRGDWVSETSANARVKAKKQPTLVGIPKPDIVLS